MPDCCSHYHIAVLEDDAALREMWCWILQDENFRVTTCATPDALLTHIHNGLLPDLLLLDLGLPPFPDSPEQGLQLLEQLREEQPDLRVIVLTGQNQDANIYRAVKAGAFDFLAKPVTEQQLLMSVQRACMFHRQEIRLQQEENSRRLVIDAPTDQGIKAVRNEAEKRLLKAVLHETEFNVHEMARRLGIKRENVYYLLKKYDLSRD